LKAVYTIIRRPHRRQDLSAHRDFGPVPQLTDTPT
jgi:hypothetical protein